MSIFLQTGESDSEPETEPENDWDGKLVDSRGLSLDAVKGSEAAAEVHVFVAYLCLLERRQSPFTMITKTIPHV